MRECVIPDVRNVEQCEGPDKITEACNDNPCPFVTEWSQWSECSKTCGGGTRSKKRECVYPRGSLENDCLEQLGIKSNQIFTIFQLKLLQDQTDILSFSKHNDIKLKNYVLTILVLEKVKTKTY